MLRRSFPVRALALSALIALLAPAAAMADTFDAAGKGLPDSVGINSLWWSRKQAGGQFLRMWR